MGLPSVIQVCSYFSCATSDFVPHLANMNVNALRLVFSQIWTSVAWLILKNVSQRQILWLCSATCSNEVNNITYSHYTFFFVWMDCSSHLPGIRNQVSRQASPFSPYPHRQIIFRPFTGSSPRHCVWYWIRKQASLGEYAFTYVLRNDRSPSCSHSRVVS